MIRADGTLSDALRDAADRIPRREAEELASFVLGLGWGELWPRMDQPFDPQPFEELIARREAGEPLQYIVGSASFYGVELACGPGVLVPRPETEILVDVALELLRDIASPVVVDLGTGTGAIAAAIASQRPDATVYATEKSPAAFAWAQRNVPSVLLGDLFEPLPSSLRGGVDLVVSNPPYVPEGTTLPADVRREPAEALFAGPDGCDVLRRIASEAPDWLRPGGWIVLEIGTPDQASVLPGARVHADLTGRLRVVLKQC